MLRALKPARTCELASALEDETLSLHASSRSWSGLVKRCLLSEGARGLKEGCFEEENRPEKCFTFLQSF